MAPKKLNQMKFNHSVTACSCQGPTTMGAETPRTELRGLWPPLGRIPAQALRRGWLWNGPQKACSATHRRSGPGQEPPLWASGPSPAKQGSQVGGCSWSPREMLPHRLLERQAASFSNGPLISRKHHLQKYLILDPFLRMTNFLSRNAWFESRKFQLQNVPSPERFQLISRNPLSSSNIIELHKGQCPL